MSDISIAFLKVPHRQAQEDGIWAWDCSLQEMVLIFPVVLALLGDNPMQSEFACHIGLRGKFFCRACWVKGSDAQAEAATAPSLNLRSSGSGTVAAGGNDSDDNASDVSEANSIPDSTEPAPDGRKGRKKAKESLATMVERIQAFLRVRFNQYSCLQL